MKTRNTQTTIASAAAVRVGLSRGRSSRLWNARSPESFRSAQGQT